MMGVWVIPFILCLHNHWWRFIFIWLLFSSITVIVMKKALEKPLDPTTPRLVEVLVSLMHGHGHSEGFWTK